MANVAMLGTGLIGMFYTMALTGKRSRDRVVVVQGRDAAKTRTFAGKHGIPRWTTHLEEAIAAPDVDVVVIGLPNHLHREAVVAAARAGKAILCTKPLARTAAEAREMLEAVEKAGVFHGYLEDLVYTPKTLKALQSVRAGAIGRVLWTRSREAHPGPHSELVLDEGAVGRRCDHRHGLPLHRDRPQLRRQGRPAGSRSSAGARHRCTRSRPRTPRSGLVRYANGAVAQFEVAGPSEAAWTCATRSPGTDGTIFLNHWLRTGIEIFAAPGSRGYVAEKAESRVRLALPGGRRGGGARLRGHVRRHAHLVRGEGARRSRRSTTATW